MKYCYTHNHINFQIGYQIQGSVVKINTASKDYINSKSEELHNQIKVHFNVLKKSVKFNKRNPPVNKAYYSVSKHLPKNVYDYTTDELATYIKDEINGIEKSIMELWEKLK